MALGVLDSVDRALLRELQNDARQTNKALADKVGSGAVHCLERVRELRARGVIRGFRAEVDPAAVGRPMEAILSVQQRCPLTVTSSRFWSTRRRCRRRSA